MDNFVGANCNVPHQPEEPEDSEDDEIIDGSE